MLVDNFICRWFSIFGISNVFRLFSVLRACCMLHSGKIWFREVLHVSIWQFAISHLFNLLQDYKNIYNASWQQCVPEPLLQEIYHSYIFSRPLLKWCFFFFFLWETFISACVTMTFRGFVFGTMLYISLQPISNRTAPDYLTASLCRFFLRYTYTALRRLLLYPGVTAGVLMY